jgi:hypothetical protein
MVDASAAPAAAAIVQTTTSVCAEGNTALICKDTDSKYKINDSNANIAKIRADYIDKIDIINNEISLTPSSSNHYFYADEKAHCSETWQDWFCIPNYHNNNKVNKYPFTKTMSVGVCYDYCAKGSNGKYMTIKNKTKCEVYDDEDDLVYNPLAIIAMFGTHFNKEADTNLQELTTLKYIGFRGSYFNDLYRVNKNDNFITDAIINDIKGTTAITIATDGTQDYQDKLLANIIKGLRNTKDTNTTILRIKKDIEGAIKTIKEFYIDGKNKEKKEIFFNKIKNYVFDIDKLEKAYGKDKNSKAKFINIIAYTYNIMYLVFYDVNGNIRADEDINTRIGKLIGFHNIAGIAENKDLTTMFLYACYNCFNVNFDNFKTYIDNNPYDDILLRIDINKDSTTTHPPKKLNSEFKKAILEIDKFATGSTGTNKEYDLSYYIKYYDHRIMAEYGEQEKNFTKILLVFAIFFACLLIICLIYGVLVLSGGHNIVIAFFNFSILYYKLVTFGILRISCVIYYHLLSRLSKYTILSILFKIFNIGFIIFLLGYLYKIITDLLGIDYITLLSNIKYQSPSEISPEDRAIYQDIALYIFITYLIYIYIYSVYIIRYSLSESNFDIMTNIDADDKTALEFGENVLISSYTSDLISIFTALKHSTSEPQQAGAASQ